MKRPLHLMFLLAFSIAAGQASAQITLEHADLIFPGDSYKLGNMQNAAGFFLGDSSGTEQAWDFSALQLDAEPAPMDFLPASAGPNAADYPEANMFFVQSLGPQGNADIYAKVDTSGSNGYFELRGMHFAANPFWPEQSPRFKPTDTQAISPFTMGNSYTDSSRLVIDINPFPHPDDSTFIIDSAESMFTRTYTVTGHGSMKTRWNTYEVLRVSVMEIRRDSFIEQSLITPRKLPNNFSGGGYSVNYQIRFHAKGYGWPLVTFVTDEDDNSVSANFIAGPLAVISARPVTKYVGDTVDFTNLFNDDVATWEWDLGDGTTSTDSAVSHVYAAADTYDIQLVVCNDLGCDTGRTMILVEDTMTSVGTRSSLPVLNVYPNPADDKLYVDVRGYANATLQIMDIRGAIRMEQSVSGELVELPLNDLETGIYIYRLSNAKGTTLHAGKFKVK